MNKTITIIVLFLALLINCKAQIIFGNSEVVDLYNRLPELLKNEIQQSIYKNPNSSFNSHFNWNDRILAVSVDHSAINNIGIQLNNLQIVSQYDSIVKAFIERTLLRLSFDKSIPDMVKTAEAIQLKVYIDNNNIQFTSIENFNELLRIINSSNHFTLSKNELLFVAEWRNNEQVLKFTFPNNYQLIVGKNKKELDQDFSFILGRMIVSDSITKETGIKLMAPDTFPISVIKGPSFMNLLSSDIFYKRIGKDSVLVFEPGLIALSVNNLFLKKEMAGKRTLKLNFHLYGEKAISYNLSFENFIDFFKNDYLSFVGIEKSNLDTIEGTLVLCHKYFNFINMLHFKSNSFEIFSNEGNIDGVLYANIPQQNINELFREFKPELKNHKILINIKKP